MRLRIVQAPIQKYLAADLKNEHSMKNILLAAALIFIAASAILAVANSHPVLQEQCEHEWEKGFEASSINDSNYLHHNNIFFTIINL
jgi:hypothetical protein